MGNHGAEGVSQNAGVPVVLVNFGIFKCNSHLLVREDSMLATKV